MGLRPGHCYSDVNERPYTRTAVKVHKKNFIGSVPGLRTRQFSMGLSQIYRGKNVSMVAESDGIVRDNAIESSRLAINRELVKRVGKDKFNLRINIFPHHILRENKQAQGAHADRIQSGMGNCPFGKPIGRAARVFKGTKLWTANVAPEDVEKAKAALKKAIIKIPLKTSMKVEDTPITSEEEKASVEYRLKVRALARAGKNVEAEAVPEEAKKAAPEAKKPAAGKKDAGAGKEGKEAKEEKKPGKQDKKK